MARFSLNKVAAYTILAIIAVLLSACSGNAPAGSAVQPEGTLQVDPVFREFHRALGGADVLGYAISSLFNQSEAQCQYTQKALMCYNPLLEQKNRYYLAPVGRELTRVDNPQPVSGQGRSRVVDGYIIYDEFIRLYDQLYGERYVGRPLSQVRYNPQLNRYEQYFENVGFFRRLDEPAGQVRLVDYGAAKCGLACSYQGERLASIGLVMLPEIYLGQINRLGGSSVFGQPLSAPFSAPDGSVVQVYERAAFSAPKGDLSQFRLKPLPLILGVAFSLPTARINDSRMVFHPVQGSLGYNVPLIFDRYIAAHGSMEVSGQPVSEVTQVEGQNLYRQCFENYCLDYDPAAPADLAIRLAPLGQAYLDQLHMSASVAQKFVYSADTVQMKFGETHPQIAQDDPQEFYLVVLHKDSQQPLSGMRAKLTVYLPNGSLAKLQFPATGADGKSRLRLPPQPSVPNGSVVQYQVCLDLDTGQTLCDTETYLVWNSN